MDSNSKFFFTFNHIEAGPLGALCLVDTADVKAVVNSRLCDLHYRRLLPCMFQLVALLTNKDN